ncbi:MAG: LPS export ABC transporter periplasmic protein LptC [Fibrobacteria bacterium]|nr:LPS export ABC transporter periplasmic protein LptC [Fibrobacteria bacterium]
MKRNIRNIKTSFWVDLVLCILFNFSLQSCYKLEEPKKVIEGDTIFPLLELKDSTSIEMFDGSALAWSLKTSYMKQESGTRVLFGRPIQMIMYDSLEHEAAWVEADSGSADENITFVSVWGNVYARNRDGACVEADSLIWKKRSGQISTEGWVKVVSEEGDTLTGVGFISDDKLENWKILSDVRTVIQKVEKRMHESEKKDSTDVDSIASEPFDSLPGYRPEPEE